jgi:hypothetical protein
VAFLAAFFFAFFFAFLAIDRSPVFAGIVFEHSTPLSRSYAELSFEIIGDDALIA